MPNPDSNETATHPPADWNLPKPEDITKPTWWPAALAFGITLTTWGMITSVIVVLTGLAVVIASLAGWIGDICHERKEH